MWCSIPNEQRISYSGWWLWPRKLMDNRGDALKIHALTVSCSFKYGDHKSNHRSGCRTNLIAKRSNYCGLVAICHPWSKFLRFALLRSSMMIFRLPDDLVRSCMPTLLRDWTHWLCFVDVLVLVRPLRSFLENGLSEADRLFRFMSPVGNSLPSNEVNPWWDVQ
jgi:hypothetical protein